MFHLTAANCFQIKKVPSRCSDFHDIGMRLRACPIQIVLNWPNLPSYHLKTVGIEELNLVTEDSMKRPQQVVY